MQAGYSNSTGTSVTFLGYRSGYSNTTGNYNTAVGAESLFSNTTGNNNTAVGYQAGYNSTGGGSTFLGNAAGTAITTGVNGVYVGNTAAASASSASYEIVIGAGATGKGTNSAFISPNGGPAYQGNNSATWSITSDQRLKKNIVDNNIGLEKITAIQVRNFEYRLPEEVDAELKPTDAIKKSGVQLGAIAQELQQVLPDCVRAESTGVMSVNSDNLIWYAINAIKELKAENDSLKARLDAANL
jgi:hypothetical protein